MNSSGIKLSDLVAGLPVEYDGPDTDIAIIDESSFPRVLSSGHPGLVRDPTPQHIMVDWVCLEHEPISYASGFVADGCEAEEKGVVPGLRKLTIVEYQRRAAAMRAAAAQKNP
ncbi:hypothetical protein [Rhodococcus sp. 06-235-1A]|uniref:hypothetical protein n=1 Tax=Rhodococcus sp. 06-235-1A TaxID=2022508 RepID=UPI00117A529C|nr:hypothetical protein [Rhodococcus sp. 06-235-1A]